MTKHSKNYNSPDAAVVDAIFAAEYAGKPVRYVEVGIYEANTLARRLREVFTHPLTTGIGIDAWWCPGWHQSRHDEIKSNALQNVSGDHRITLWEMTSTEAAFTLDPRSRDVIYIDADHRSWAVYVDALIFWPALKVGGYMLFDDCSPDYWRNRDGEGPLQAVERFLTLEPSAEVIHKNHQILVRRTE